METPEFTPRAEGHEDPEWSAFCKALDREEALMRKVDELLESSTDRLAAERIIATQYAASIEEAMAASKRALDAWLQKIRSYQLGD